MRPRHPIETVLLAVVAVSLVVGIAGAWIDQRWYEQVYATEIGPVELGTAAAFLVASGVAIWTAWRSRGRLPALTWSGLALLCFFAAGEELSWGQHLFRWASPEFFAEHNAQRETNLHNLVVAGVKLNKLVFSQILLFLAALYLLALPWLHHRNRAFARLVDALGVPVPRALHVVAVLVTFAAVALVRSRQRDELSELGGAIILLLVLLFPRNAAAIRPGRAGAEPVPSDALGARR